MGKGKRVRKQVNYGDGEVRGAPDDGPWQDNISEYNSDFSMPSDEDQVKSDVAVEKCSLHLLLGISFFSEKNSMYRNHSQPRDGISKFMQ